MFQLIERALEKWQILSKILKSQHEFLTNSALFLKILFYYIVLDVDKYELLILLLKYTVALEKGH